MRKKFIHHSGGNLLLRPHALWAQERWTDIPTDHAYYPKGPVEPQHRSLHQQHCGEDPTAGDPPTGPVRSLR
jgi:hypothetical protein